MVGRVIDLVNLALVAGAIDKVISKGANAFLVIR